MLAGIQQANTHLLLEMLETTFKLLAVCEGTLMSDWQVIDNNMPFLLKTCLAVLIKLRTPKVVLILSFCRWITLFKKFKLCFIPEKLMKEKC